MNNTSPITKKASPAAFAPFPFSNRPELPEIDAHLSAEKLVRLGMLQKAPIRDDTHDTLRKKDNGVSGDPNEKFGEFSRKVIVRLYKFIKSCGLEEKLDGITLEDLHQAIRKVNRARNSLDEEMHARRLMKTFEFLLRLSGKSTRQWFKEVDTSQNNKGDGKLTWAEFEAGMEKLCADLGAAVFPKPDLLVMLKYMDPNGDGDLSAAEVKRAFQRIQKPAEASQVLSDAGPIIPYILQFCKDRQIRIRDYFNFLDTNKSKIITVDKLLYGLEKMHLSKNDPREHLIDARVARKKEHAGTSTDEENTPAGTHAGNYRPPTRTGRVDWKPFEYEPQQQKNDESNVSSVLSPNDLIRPTWVRLASDGNVKATTPTPSTNHRKRRESKARPAKLPNLTSKSLLRSSLEALESLEHKYQNGTYSPERAGVHYQKMVKREVDAYSPWLQQFDNKLKSGISMMSRM